MPITEKITAYQPSSLVVAVHYSVLENDAEKLREVVTMPVERVLKTLERVAQIDSTTSHGTVDIEIRFQGEVTEQDVQLIAAQIEMLKFDDSLAILSRTVEVRQPRLSFDDLAKD